MKRNSFIFLAVGWVALLCGPSAALAQVQPPLGLLLKFGALGFAGVTGQTGGGAVINGDVGSSPTPAISNFFASDGGPSLVVPPFVVHVANDADVQQAQIDATTASAALLIQGPGTIIPDEMGGTSRGPGVYSFLSGAAGIAGTPGLTTLTLDGAGTYIFLVGSSITANVLSNVNLINGASPCNVFWRVGISATLNGIDFPGTVIAHAGSVTVGDNMNLTGRVVSRTGAVTMPGDGGTLIGGCSALALPAPTFSTQVASPSVTLGAAVSDTATLLSLAVPPAPTGTIIFTLYGPNDLFCAGLPIFTSPPVAVNGNGSYGSPAVPALPIGAYRWIASYSGDANNAASAGTCGDANESVDVNALAASIPIPTLSEWGMIILAGLLALFGFVAMRRQTR